MDGVITETGERQLREANLSLIRCRTYSRSDDGRRAELPGRRDKGVGGCAWLMDSPGPSRTTREVRLVKPGRQNRRSGGGPRAPLWGQDSNWAREVGIVDRLLDAAGKEPLPEALWVEAEEAGHALGKAQRVAGQTVGKVEHVL